jgi:hypothetical protein
MDDPARRPVLPVPVDEVGDSETLVAVMSGVQRRGAWEPAERVRVVAVMGGAELDFREAVLVEGVTELWIFAFWGGAQVIVPSDIHVETRGIGIMGGFSPLDHRAADPDAPTLRITGWALMGGVDVKLKSAGELASRA